jgi:Cellulase (glycosyl hydrolase family 5)
MPAPEHPRGRVRVGKGTVLTDEGSLLRMVHCHVHDHFAPFHGDPLWWQTLREVGHFNTVRAMGYLGRWPRNPQAMDLPTLLPLLDSMVELSEKAGLYLLIDNHSECCGNQDVPNDSAFWEAVAPRYKDRTHVFYEVKNEPWQYSGLSEYMRTMYSLVRPLAPDTHLILWTIENLIELEDPLSMIRSLPEVDYSNASVGIHPYKTIRRRHNIFDSLGMRARGRAPRMRQLLELIQVLQANYPTIMTEIGPNAAGAPGQEFLMVLEAMGISWGYLGGTGFTDARTGKVYGGPSEKLSILWPPS